MSKHIEYYFEVIRATKTRFWSRIIRNNHKILWTSEQYTTKQNAMKPVDDMVSAIGKSKCVVIFTDRTKKEEK